MENKKILETKDSLKKDLVEKITLKDLEDLRVKYLGKKGLITELNSEIKIFQMKRKKNLVCK